MHRRIIHVDMDEFFAAVEKLDRPELRGKCILVGGDPSGRGVVSTASYEARKYGCHSAMPMTQAMRLCPQAVVLPVRGSRYREVSDQVFEVFRRYTPLIEPLSIDEAFLDVTGSERLFGSAERIGREIQNAIRDELHLQASIGLAPNKFLAKLASDLEKPAGFTVITEENVHRVLDPLSVRKLWGVGPVVEKRLGSYGIRTVGELRRADENWLRSILGNAGPHFRSLAAGEDDRPVTPDSEAKSIGQEQTFAKNVADRSALEAVLFAQVEHVGRRLRAHKLLARTVTLKIRHGDFTTLTRSATLDDATNITRELWEAAKKTFDTWARGGIEPLRLLGFTASQLAPRAGTQLGLFDNQSGREKQRRLDETLDEIQSKYGLDGISRAKGFR